MKSHFRIKSELFENRIIDFYRTISSVFYRTFNFFAVNNGGKQTTITIIDKVNVWPCINCPFDSRTLYQHTSGFFLLSQVLPDIRLHGYRESINFYS